MGIQFNPNASQQIFNPISVQAIVLPQTASSTATSTSSPSASSSTNGLSQDQTLGLLSSTMNLFSQVLSMANNLVGSSSSTTSTPTTTTSTTTPTTTTSTVTASPTSSGYGTTTATTGTTGTTSTTTSPTASNTGTTVVTINGKQCIVPVTQTTATSGTSGTTGTTGTTSTSTATPTNIMADGGGSPLNIFTKDDYKNFLLAGSKGGTQGTAESIDPSFSDPNSRFANSSNAGFQAAVAGMYANQFKGYALGQDVAFAPGKDIDQIANNLTNVQNQPMTAEAETLSKVAALYRGNLTGPNLYDNAKLKDLLVQWGRTDIANQPNVGSQNGDVQSIGGVVKALNEQTDPAIRKQWLNQIFDFQNNTASSPSGAVPNLEPYQKAINIVRDGTFDSLLNNYQGISA